MSLGNKEGAGNAGCLVHPRPRVRRKVRELVTTGTPKQSGIPCAMVLRLISCSPRCAGLDSHRRPATRLAELDPSVGGSGPHDFAVRISRRSSAGAKRVHRIPRSTFVTIGRNVPLAEAGFANTIINFGKTEDEFFTTKA